VVLGREHSTVSSTHKKKNGTDQLLYFPTPPRIPTEVNLLIPITVKGKLEKMQTPVGKKKGYHEWRTLVDSPDGVLNKRQPSVGGEEGG
jgi:hypothetical protein